MKKTLILLTLSAVLQQECMSQQFSKDNANTYVVIAGALEWKDALNPFDKKHRKDEELSQKLVSIGIPAANITTMLDAQATKSAIEAALKSAADKADANSTIIFYYAGHGINSKEGIYFANYDINLNNMGKTGFAIKYLSETLGKSKASNIWLLADCCYSGGLIKECQTLGKAGKKAIALSSATASNVSTGNWTYTQTLLDCMAGNPLADHDQDGNITLGELKKEMRMAMKSRERQMNGAELQNVEESTVFAKTSGKMGTAGKWANGTYLWGKEGKQWKPVRVLSASGSGYSVEFYNYSDKVQKTLAANELREMHFVKHKEGTSVQVEWEGKWYPAKVLKVSGDFAYIQYDGYDESYNEWVLYDRVRTGSEKKVKVWETDAYYPAEVLEEKDGLFYIHYDGYGNDWDEWVDKSRIK